MSTSAGDLLDTVAEIARRPAGCRQSTPTAAGAARAMGHLSRALGELRLGGIAPTVGNEREQLVSELAATCSAVAQRAPLGQTELCSIAAAAADALALAGLRTTVAGRWAMTTEVIDTVTVLSDIVADTAVGPEITERCAAIGGIAVRLQREAALNPPAAQHFEALDRPIPRPGTALLSDGAAVVRESTAQLLYASEQRDTRLTVAQVLVRAIAAEALTHAVESRHQLGPRRDGHAGAAESWRAFRAALAPFDDGSRRPQRVAEPGTSAAVQLHAALHRAGDRSGWDTHLCNAADAAVQLLPTLARQLERTLHRWTREGSLVAYACDLPYQDGRAHAFLAGRTPAGLIRVLLVEDLKPAVAALRRTGLLTAAMAARASENASANDRFPRRLADSHRATLAQMSAVELGAAQRRAFEQLNAARPIARRGR